MELFRSIAAIMIACAFMAFLYGTYHRQIFRNSWLKNEPNSSGFLTQINISARSFPLGNMSEKSLFHLKKSRFGYAMFLIFTATSFIVVLTYRILEDS
jgi:hypothetical protein